MEMTPVWKERKSKSPFPLFPHCLGKLANTASLPHSHSFGDDLGFLFSTSSFNFNFDESVTDMPGTFCYRHARSLRASRTRGFKPLRRHFPLNSVSAAFGSSTCEEDITFAAFNS